MMNRVPLIVSVLLAAAVCSATAADKPAVVKLEAPPRSEWQVIPADPELTTLAVDAAGEWFLIDEVNARLKPAADGKSAEFAASVDGHYRLVVICGKAIHRIELVRSFTPPQPMPPGPGPTPPTPPPAPADPLVTKFTDAYRLDTRDAGVKVEELKTLAALYSAAAELPYQKADDGSFTLTTAEGLAGKVIEASKSKELKVAGLLDLRKAIAAEIKAVFPVNELLTDDGRKKAADLFKRIKAALEAVK